MPFNSCSCLQAGTSIKSHQEGVSSFSYSNTNKRPVSVICYEKKILLLNNFCIKKIIIKINKGLLNLSCHLLRTYYTPGNLIALHTG